MDFKLLPIGPVKGNLDGVLTLSTAYLLVILWVVGYIAKSLYNISPWHPLAKFPGPRIAAATFLYEAYYDWILEGRYTHEIRAMHKKYGRQSIQPWFLEPRS